MTSPWEMKTSPPTRYLCFFSINSSIINRWERENENAKSSATSSPSQERRTVVPFEPEESTGLTITGSVNREVSTLLSEYHAAFGVGNPFSFRNVLNKSLLQSV